MSIKLPSAFSKAVSDAFGKDNVLISNDNNIELTAYFNTDTFFPDHKKFALRLSLSDDRALVEFDGSELNQRHILDLQIHLDGYGDIKRYGDTGRYFMVQNPKTFNFDGKNIMEIIAQAWKASIDPMPS